MSFARVRALAVVGALFTCAVVFVVMALAKDTQTTASTGGGCPADYVPADLRLPDENRDIKINVFNATKRIGLAEQVGTDFANREFTVKKKANDPRGKQVDKVAVLRYGPKAVGAAWVLRAYFLADADTEFDIGRKDDLVDVVIGTRFRQLATPTEMRQALAALGRPALPKGTCDANAR